MFQQLKQTYYIKTDTIIKRDFVKFLYKILRFIRYDNRSNSERIIIIYIYFESQFRINFISFYEITDIQNFID